MRVVLGMLAALLLLTLSACGESDKSNWSFASTNDGIPSSGGASFDFKHYSKTAAEGLYSDTW